MGRERECEGYRTEFPVDTVPVVRCSDDDTVGTVVLNRVCVPREIKPLPTGPRS